MYPNETVFPTREDWQWVSSPWCPWAPLSGDTRALGRQFTASSQLRCFDTFLCGEACLPPLVTLGAWGELPPAPGTQPRSQSSGEIFSLGAASAPAIWLKCTRLEDAMR